MKIIKYKIFKLLILIKNLLNLTEDFDEPGTTESIRLASDFKSGNAWSLVFAIFIASIGLQTNSTAVIIGAMLISPLMGTIVGAGFSLGIHDFELLKKSIKNLAYAVLISVSTSAIFFLLSPSSFAQSELLARTKPTFFDVLIAFFGGAAGIVASSRKIKSNAIPGVAIATALMPPLCTVGYGIAHLNFNFIIGALYLFIINSTFIFMATYLLVKLLGFSPLVDQNPLRNKKIHKWMSYISIIAIIPSLYMAWYLHKKSKFENSALTFIEKEFNFQNTIIGQKEFVFNLSKPTITIKTIGENITSENQLKLQNIFNEKYDQINTQINIIPIAPDSIAIENLEKKFVTKNDLIQLTSLKKNRKQDILLRKTLILNLKLKDKFSNVFVSSEIRDDKIEFIWQKKPSQSQLAIAEKISYDVMNENHPIFLHTILVK